MTDQLEPHGNAAKRHSGQFLKFGIVGGFNTGLDFLVYTIVVVMGAPPVLSNIIAFAVANPTSFFVNSRFTFRRDGRPAKLSFSKYGKFLAAHLASLLISTSIVWAFASEIGAFSAKFAAIVVTVFINYTASALLVFKAPATNLPTQKEKSPRESA
ncbi:MAG: GtrA family protein [Marinicaulis sp.]|nr:GtrA family protein [Marinicaulis sp.]